MRDAQHQAERASRCPTCNKGGLRDKVVTERFEFEVDGKTKTVVAENVPVSECDNTECGERLSGPEAAGIRHEAICRTFGLLTPREIQAIRERLELSQERFAQLTGIGVATISRWERGRLLQNRAMDNLLRLVERSEENIRFLEGQQDNEQMSDRTEDQPRGPENQETASRTRGLEWLRTDYTRALGSPFQHFYCPMLMKDESVELMLGHVVNEKFKDVPEFKIKQRQDIESWYGSMFEADFLTLMQHRDKNIEDLFFAGKAPCGLKPVIKAGPQEIEYYQLQDDPEDLPIDEHTLIEINGKNGGFMRLALKKSPEEILSLQHVKWHSEAFGDFRIAALVSTIKAAYLTLFWKLGYQYTLRSSAGLSVGHDMLGRFFVENRGKIPQQVRAAAVEFFRPYVNMVRPVESLGEKAPQGTIEDNRAFVWLGSSGRGLGIGVFVRTNDRLHCVLMPAYSDAEGAESYLDFLRNDKEVLWVRASQYSEDQGCWEVHPQRLRVLWPKLDPSFDLSRSPQEILSCRSLAKEQRQDNK
ncbi:MAG: type II toxin-antitoxin system MqsA family antitoxin [Gemmataceae bacterium]